MQRRQNKADHPQRRMPLAALAIRSRGGVRHPARPDIATSNSQLRETQRLTGRTSTFPSGLKSHLQKHPPAHVLERAMGPPDGNWLRYTGREWGPEPLVARTSRGAWHLRAGDRDAIPLASNPSASPRIERRKLRIDLPEPITTPSPAPPCGGRN